MFGQTIAKLSKVNSELRTEQVVRFLIPVLEQVYTMRASQSSRNFLENGIHLFRIRTYFLIDADAIWRSFTPFAIYSALGKVPSEEIEPVIHRQLNGRYGRLILPTPIIAREGERLLFLPFP